MSNEISEYQKVAALVCMDIETAAIAAANKPESAPALLRLLKEQKDKAINDKSSRDERYKAACLLFSLPQAKDNDR